VFELVRALALDLARLLRRTAKRSRSLRQARRRLAGARQRASLEISGLRSLFSGSYSREGGVDPANMIWIFGSGRSGSTWLRSMMGEMGGYRVWDEPMVGRLFGEFYARTPKENLSSPNFVMGDPIRKGWTRSIRNFVLDGAAYSNPGLSGDDYLVVKEPNGSIGAPLLMEALPESRMILLVRDPRDVVASVLDAAREGGWLYESRNEGRSRKRNTADAKPRAFVRERARVYRRGVENAKRAYEAHRGPKVLVRYEDLRVNTLGEMERIYSSLGIPVDRQALARAVEKHSWENVPEEEKGRGKARRKAMLGGWREDLSPEQARVVERVTASLLEEFYPDRGDGSGT
jgi:Sulfotransferase family